MIERWRAGSARIAWKSAILASSSAASSRDLLTLEGREAPQLQLEDRGGLVVVDLEQRLQALARVVGAGGAADERDDLVERVESLEQTAQDMHALFGLAQARARAAHDDLDLVRDPQADEPVDRERARHVVDDREHVRAEVVLQLRVFVEVVEHDLRDGVALEHDDETLTRAVRGLVTDVGDARDLAVAREIANLDRNVVGVDLIRQLGDDEARAALDLFDVDDGAHRDRSAPRAVRLVNAACAEDLRRSREVRALDAFDQCVLQFFRRGIRILQCPQRTRCDLTQVVGRNVRRHADGDTDRTVDEQVGEPRRQNGGLLRLTVVVVLEVDGIFFDVAHHLERERRHLGLGVARGGGLEVSRRTEVALTERERVAQRPWLHEAHERVVDRRVTVRVVLTHHFADDARALRERLVGAETAVVHAIDHAAVHGLHAVAHIGQRTPDDDAHRIVEIAALHLGVEIDLVDAAVVVVGHGLGTFVVCHRLLFFSRLGLAVVSRWCFAGDDGCLRGGPSRGFGGACSRSALRYRGSARLSRFAG